MCLTDSYEGNERIKMQNDKKKSEPYFFNCASGIFSYASK